MAAATTNYFNQKRSTVGPQLPGYTQRILVAPKSDFTAIAPPDGALGIDATTVSAADHTFGVGKGFYTLYAQIHKSEAPGATAGEPGGLTPVLWTPKFTIMGDTPATQQLLDALMNDDLIVLMEDPTAGTSDPSKALWQFGNSAVPLAITKMDPQSGTSNSGQRSYAIESVATMRYNYQGTVTLHA